MLTLAENTSDCPIWLVYRVQGMLAAESKLKPSLVCENEKLNSWKGGRHFFTTGVCKL